MNCSNSLFFNSCENELDGFFKELNEIFANYTKKMPFSSSSPLMSETDMKRSPNKSHGKYLFDNIDGLLNKSHINNFFDESLFNNVNNFKLEALPEIRKKVFDWSKNNKMSIEIGDICMKLGNIHAQLNDNVGALECYENAIKIYINCEHGEVKCAECFKSFSNFYMKYDIESSINNLDICINLYTKNFGQNCLENADCYYKKGICVQKQEKWNEAKEYYSKSLELYEKNLNSKESILIADCYFKLGKVNEKLEIYETALSFYKNSLNIYLKKLGNSHINIGNNYYNIGIIYENMLNYPLSIENYINSNKIFSLISGENSEDYIDTLISIAVVYNKSQNYEESINYYEKALSLCSYYNNKTSKELFKLHSDLLAVYIPMKNTEKITFHLICCLNLSENDNELILFLQDNVKKYIEKCGKDIQSTVNNGIDQYIERLIIIKEIPIKIAEILNVLGKSFSKSENSLKSIDLLNKSLGFFEKSENFNTKSIQLKVCEIYNLLGMEYDKLKNYDQSFVCFSLTLKIRKKYLGTDHLKTAGAYNNLAIALDKLDKFVDSLESWKKCMEIRLKKLDSNDIKIANSFYNLSIILFKMKDYEESIKYMQMSFDIYNERLGLENMFSADASINLGELYRIINIYSKAESYLLIAQKIYSKKQENFETNVNYLKTSCLLGCTYSENKKYEQAIDILKPIITQIRIVFGESNLMTLDALFELGISLSEKQDLETSLKYLVEVKNNPAIKLKWSENKIKSLTKKHYKLVLTY